MVVVLPSAPLPATFTHRLSSASNDMVPSFGGPITRALRAGGHWVFDVRLEPMPYAQLLEWSDLDDPTVVVAWAIPQPSIDTGDPGTPAVDGGGQAGSSILLRGVTPGYVVQKGRWLSIRSDGQGYLYRCTKTATATAGGALTLDLNPILRTIPADGDAVELASPMIEGLVAKGSAGMSVDVRAANTRDVSFRIEERD